MTAASKVFSPENQYSGTVPTSKIPPYYRLMTNTSKHCQGCGEPLPLPELYCDTCERVPVHAGYTRAQLSTAFDSVKNRENWKLPIDKVLPLAPIAEQDLLTAAVVFYAGCTPKFQYLGANMRVVAAGYYAAVGA